MKPSEEELGPAVVVSRVNYWLPAAIRYNSWYLIVIALHAIATIAVSITDGVSVSAGMLGTLGNLIIVLLPLCLLVLTVTRLPCMLREVGTTRPLVWMARDLRRALTGGDAPYGGCGTVVAFLLFCAYFTRFKNAIPAINPYFV